jgi:hypothetical protein
MRNVPDGSCRGNQNTFYAEESFFPKIVPFMRYADKYGTAKQATYNTAH